MKKYKKLFLLIIAITISLFVVFISFSNRNKTTLTNKAAETTRIAETYRKSFVLPTTPSEKMNSNTTFVQNSVIPLKHNQKIGGLAVSADISLKQDVSLVRIVLVDTSNNEYLVYETYPLIADSNIFFVTDVCEETCFLNGVIPSSLRIEIVDSTANIKQISFVSPIAQSATQIQENGTTRKNDQDMFKVTKLNDNKLKAKIRWQAGQTPISQMTYAQKKKLFIGNVVPNLQGFEYYKGGVFEWKSSNPSSNSPRGGGYPSPTIPYVTPTFTPTPTQTPPLIDRFDWRNRHGQNWMTSVKNQLTCGSCWAFSVTSALEALTNLWFNKHLDLDLSEQDILSCSNGGSCQGGWTYVATEYISNQGIVDENSFPYNNSDISCDKKSNSPTLTVKSSGHEEIWGWMQPNNDYIFKIALIKEGPVSGAINSWHHAMALIGYYTDSLDKKTIWIFKNSWGSSWGENGYANVKFTGKYPLEDLWVSVIKKPITIKQTNNVYVNCIDNDHDSYCNWGIGPKPAVCPSLCKAEEDCDDSNSAAGPFAKDYSCTYLRPSPIPTFPYTTRQDMCLSLAVSSSSLNLGQSVTMTSTTKPNYPANTFSYAFYNLDNVVSPGNPKPVCVTTGGDDVSVTSPCPAGSHQLIYWAPNMTTRNLASRTLTYTNTFPIDIQTGTQVKRTQINAYFRLGTNPTSLPNAACVRSITATVPTAIPLPSSVPTSRPTPTAQP